MKYDLDDKDFVEAFEQCTLPNSQFHHESHVRLTWLYLRNYSLPRTLEMIWTGIQRFAEVNGQTRLFNQTITVFFTLLIHQRVMNNPSLDWENFCRENGDLFDFRSCVSNYYDFELVKSDAARDRVLFPQRIPAR